MRQNDGKGKGAVRVSLPVLGRRNEGQLRTNERRSPTRMTAVRMLCPHCFEVLMLAALRLLTADSDTAYFASIDSVVVGGSSADDPSLEYTVRTRRDVRHICIVWC
jgi:hypothetical protein